MCDCGSESRIALNAYQFVLPLASCFTLEAGCLFMASVLFKRSGIVFHFQSRFIFQPWVLMLGLNSFINLSSLPCHY